MNTTSKSSTIIDIARRAMTLAVMGLAVAVAVAAWSSPQSVDAAPKAKAKPAPAAVADRDTADDASAPDDGDQEGQNTSRKKRAKKAGKNLTGTLNLNTASEAELVLLPGIGPSKAKRVLEYRTSRGKFQRVRDLRRVKGIGAKTLQKLEPYLAISGETTLRLE